jgi:hypothetical protein
MVEPGISQMFKYYAIKIRVNARNAIAATAHYAGLLSAAGLRAASIVGVIATPIVWTANNSPFQSGAQKQ